MTTILFSFSLATAWAQQPPVIAVGPVNAASYVPMRLPSGGIAQGSMFIVKGVRMGNPGTQIASAFPLQPNMGGTVIRVTVGGVTLSGLMIYVVTGIPNTQNPDQLAAILPSNTPIGAGTLQVLYQGRASNTVAIRVVANSFGMFTRNQNGTGPVIVQNFISGADTPTNGLLEASNPGQTEILWGTGLGAVNPASEVAGPVPGDLPLNVEVWVGGRRANVTYKGRSGCCAGIDQIVFTVPAGVEGCYVAILVRVNGVTSVAGTMSVASNGRVCAEPSSLSAADIARIQRTGPIGIGNVFINRIRITVNLPGLGSIDNTIDQGEGNFRRYATTGDVMASTAGSVSGLQGSPSPGACVAVAFPFDDDPFSAVFPEIDEFTGSEMDAGAALRLNGPRGLKQLPRQMFNGQFDGYFLQGDTFLGGGVSFLGGPILPLYLDPGTITVDNATGGSQVGAFTSSLTIPANPATWTSQTAGGMISRAQDLTVTWSGGAPGELVVLIGSAADPAIGAGASFICVERAQAGTLTVPSWVLGVLPASGTSDGVPVGFMTFGTGLAQPSRFTATGLDLGYFDWATMQLKNVVFQ